MSVPDRFSDLRVLRFFDRIDAALAGEQIGPIRASIDLTNLCTHRCPWCEPLAFRTETIKDKNHTLPYNVALEVLHDLREMDCKTINLSGGGEPTLHPQFGLVLQGVANMGFRSWIVTHGGLMHDWMDELLIADHIRISLDASNAKEHAEMHGTKGLEYERVLQNVTDLCGRRVNGSPEVGLAYIVSDCNSAETSIRRVLGFASGAGVDFIHFRPLSEEKADRFKGTWNAVVQTIERIATEFPTVKVFPLGKRGGDVFLQRDFNSCYSALTAAVISANGDVAACCDRRDIRFGNVNERSFKSIWLSARHREIAEKIEPKFCTRCLQANYNRAVEKFIVNNESLPELI